MPDRSRSLGVLSRSPAFAALFTARAVSLLGDGVGNLALVVHVQRVQGTGTAVGLLLLVVSLPSLLSPITGAVADRVDKRRVLAMGEVGQGLLLGAAVVWLPPLPVLLALLLAKETISAIAEPAGRSAIPALVADEDLPAANALMGSLREAGEVLGPLAGGMIVAASGVRAGLAVDAFTFLLSVPLLSRIPALPPGSDGGDEPAAGLTASAWTGLRYTLSHPVTRALTVAFFFVGLAAADDVAIPFLARILGAGERGIGALYSAVGAGLIVGYAVIARWGRRLPPAQGFVLGGAVAALGTVMTSGAPSLITAISFQVVRGMGIAALETSLQTLVQRTVPARMLGRVFANVYGAVNVAACMALLAGGPLLDATSARVVLVASGVVPLAGIALSAGPLVRARGRGLLPL